MFLFSILQLSGDSIDNVNLVGEGGLLHYVSE